MAWQNSSGYFSAALNAHESRMGVGLGRWRDIGRLFALLVLVGSRWNLVSPWSDAAWSRYWRITAIGAPIVVAVVTGLWFTWGATRDLRRLFARLRQAQLNPIDNGRVEGHRNLDDAAAAPAIKPSESALAK